MLAGPADAHPAPSLLERVLRGHLEVLPHYLDLPAPVQLDHESRDHPRIRDLGDPALLDLELARMVERVEDADLLGTDSYPAPVTLHDVRHADEVGDEL